MKPHVVKFFQFLEAKEGKNAPLRVKLLNPDMFKITKDDLNVKGNLDLYRTNIKALPKDLKVGGHLILTYCTSLESLTNNLQVVWDLSLSGCTSLESLPNNLQVGGDLYLVDCTSLKSLPEDLQVGDDLYLENTPLAEMYSVDEIIDMIEAKGGYVNGHIEI